VWQWVEPIRQEKRAKGYFGVRIELDDLAPGQDRKVVLTNIDGPIWLAKQRIKEAKSMQIKKVGRVSSYQPEAAARGASSAARGRAEQAFSRLTAKAAEPTIESLTSGQRDAMAGVIEHHYGKLTALDLRDAAERVLKKADAPPGNGRKGVSSPSARGGRDAASIARDPGEERPARDLAPCTTCGVRTGEPCEGNVRPGCSPRLVFGVHEARARAAKLRVPADDREHVRPARAPTNGVRKVAAVRPMLAWVRLPWDGGKLRPDPRLDGPDAPERVRYAIPGSSGPLDHVTLTRRRHESARTGVCWLYE
jgi:hypothetical protein